MKFLTWNVNSVRKRKDLIEQLILNEDPDFLLLQETKASDDKFPSICNYYRFMSGDQGRNGVAILTKHNCEIYTDFHYQGRLLSVLYDNILISTLYMYNGFSNLSPKEKKKQMFDWMTNLVKNIDRPFIIGGDFNVLYKSTEYHKIKNPYEADEILCYQNFEKHVENTTPDEHWITWWDYREFSFQYNKGFGLDKFYIKNGLKFHKPVILKDYRAMQQPSDHAPVKIIIDIL
jgi:exodeoxyribonuclease-3